MFFYSVFSQKKKPKTHTKTTSSRCIQKQSRSTKAISIKET